MRLKLEDNCDFINGGSWTADEYSAIGYPVLKVSNFDKDSISYDDLSYLQKESYPKYRRNELKLFDIVIATVGSHPSLINSAAGRVITIPKSGEGLLLNQNAVCLRTNNPKVIDQRYLGYLCKSQVFQHFIQQRGKGAANQMRIPIGGIKSFEYDFPKIQNQHKIAAILSAYDDLIENNLKRIKLLEEKAQLTYEEWFVRMKFPGHESTPINEETGLPEGWKFKSLGDFTKVFKGKNITKNTIREGNVPVVAGGLKPAYYHNTANAKSPVITVSASGANAGFTSLYHEDIWASDCSYIDSSMTEYLHFLYSSMIYNQAKIYHFQKGAAQPHVYPKDLARLEIIIPTVRTLKKYEEKALKMFGSIKLLKNQNQLLKEARDILLPRLMTGMIDVDSLDLSAFEGGEHEEMLMVAEEEKFSKKQRI